MKIYYSGAEMPDQPQAIPSQSLGGYKSDTVVPQGVPGNILDALSTYAKQRGNTSVRGLFLVNEESTAIENLKLYLTYPTDLVGKIKVEFAAVTANNGNEIERIDNGNSSPYYATFVENTDENNPTLLIDSLEAGGVIGLWIRRIINPTPSPSCDDLYDVYKEIVPPADLSNINIPPAPVAPSNELPNIVKEEVKLNFSWD